MLSSTLALDLTTPTPAPFHKGEGKQQMGGNVMLRRTVLKGIAANAAGGFIARPAVAADTVLKIGMSMPMTGAGFAAVGRQLKAAIQL